MSSDAESFSPSGTWATFKLADELFAVPVEEVQEVLMHQPLTPIPLAPAHIVGLLNLRGQIMPAIDLRRRLHFAPLTSEHSGSIIVLKSRGHMVSLLVDEIGDVLPLAHSLWRPTPDTLPARHRIFVFGICPTQGEIVLGLRVDTLSGDDELPGEAASRLSDLVHA